MGTTREIYLAAAIVVTLLGGPKPSAAPYSSVSAPERDADAGGDPMSAILRSLNLHRDAKVATISHRGSCEAGELAKSLQLERVTSLEIDGLAASTKDPKCPEVASGARVRWLGSGAGDAKVPLRDLDLIWMAGGFHQLYVTLAPARMASFLRELASAIKPGGAIVIVDRMADSRTPADVAAQTGKIDPQIVLEGLEGAGLRLQSYATDASGRGDQRTARTANRFVMLFRPSGHGTR